MGDSIFDYPLTNILVLIIFLFFMLLRSRTIVVMALRSDLRSAKREERRLKSINTLSPDFTGEDPFNPWADTKRV